MDVRAALEQALDLHRQGRLADAERLYSEVLQVAPGEANALHLLGVVAMQAGDLPRALALMDRALASSPLMAGVHYNRGVVLRGLERPTDAIASFDAAIALKADYAEAFSGRGAALHDLHRLTEAAESFARAIALNPRNADAYSNQAKVLLDLGRPRDAIAQCDKAIALSPGFAEGYVNKSLSLLTLGEYKQGFELYEWRAAVVPSIGARAGGRPQWTGPEDVSGKTVFLTWEQGFGDTIQFVRYAPLLAQRGARVVLEVQPELHRLLARLSGVDRVVARGDKLPPFDLHCPLMSLPHAFKTTVASIPAQTPYLSIAHPQRAKWAGVLPAGKPLVGICWAGEKSHRNDVNRSVPLASFAKLWDGVDAHIVSLQYRPDDEARAFLRACGNVTETSERLEDFVDTAALISCLDVVVTADTAVAHLAGALSVPTIVMLPRSADFRWLRMRDDSPWYPTVKLFRHPAHKDWDAVVVAVRQNLLNNFCVRRTAEASCAGL